MTRQGDGTEPGPAPAEIYSISRLNREVKSLLDASFPLIWVEGEISNLARPSSGHLYFSLKDGGAQVRCALFRGQARALRAQPREGMQVLARARATLYEGRGEFQLVIHYLEEAGEGALRRAFEALKAKLAAEGLFDEQLKRPPPLWPRRIGVITSPTGAAVRDVVTTLRRRCPAVPVLIYPVPVQGAGAGERIAAALRLASERAECDCLILARGGGSLEDLWAFNEEVVARAIRDCAIPVICGVGHEIDFTIADLAADRRAPTPTAAAELATPDSAELAERLAAYGQRLRRLVANRLTDRFQRVDWVAGRLVHPSRRLADMDRRVAELARRLRLAAAAHRGRLHSAVLRAEGRLSARAPAARLAAVRTRSAHAGRALRRAMALVIERGHARARAAGQRLTSVSPLATLERGYAIVQRADDGSVVRSAAALKPGERTATRLADGVVDSRVEGTRRS
jgi:exodeoxyribonuclease VII large subunit